MIGRKSQIKTMKSMLQVKKSEFLAVTGRRRVGKTFLIEEQFKANICLSVTGIQEGDQSVQLLNFAQKLAEYSHIPIVNPPSNWQQTFILLKSYLQALTKKKKQVIFLDELPWMATARSGFIQLLAHLWNDYLSKEKHFILVICGSATSWITKKIVNDKGGFHNRLTQRIHLAPFTLAETKAFLQYKNIHLSDDAIIEIYMAMGGIPFYLEQIRKGETATTAIERLCFTENGLLKNEYDNLYKAVFDYPENHEAIVRTLATSKSGLTRAALIKKSKVDSGGPYTRAMEDLIVSGFVEESIPFGKKKQGALYRLVDEYSVFYHKFISTNKRSQKGIWQILSASQTYKIWTGYAFENLCLKHLDLVKKALGIQAVYTEYSSFSHKENNDIKGFDIDIVIERRDLAINLCECKYYSDPITITSKYADQLKQRKSLFRQQTKTTSKKTIFTTLISNQKPIQNQHFLESIDSFVHVSALMK